MFFWGFFEMSLFPSIFCTISAFSLSGEYVVRSFLPNGVFYLVITAEFLTSAYYVRIQSTQSIIITILPVVTEDLPISPWFTPYDFLSRCKFSNLTTRQPMVILVTTILTPSLSLNVIFFYAILLCRSLELLVQKTVYLV